MSFEALTLGMLLPDLVDKPLFYFFHGYGLISSTRTFGHAGLTLLVLCLIAWRFPSVTSLAAGFATHLGLDALMDLVLNYNVGTGSEWIALAWPFRGLAFDTTQAYTNLTGHLASLASSRPIAMGELVGIPFTVWAFTHRRDYGRRRW